MSKSLNDYDVISSRNLFSSKTQVKKTDEIDLTAEPVLSSLPLQLMGTVIFKNPLRCMAAVQDKTESKLYPVRPGDEILNNVRILEITARRVIFVNAQARRKEYIELPEDQTMKITSGAGQAKTGNIAEVDENKFVVNRNEINSQLANFNSLITQARAIPEMRGGQMIGFRLTQIQKGSFFEKVGMKDNDILKEVNGQKVTDAAKALSLLQDLKTAPSVDLTLERNGKDVGFNYDIQ